MEEVSRQEKIIRGVLSGIIAVFVLVPILIIRSIGKLFKKEWIVFDENKERTKYGKYLYDTWFSEKEAAQNNRVFVYFLYPALSCFSIFVALPFFRGMWFSLTDWDGLNTGNETFVGFKNYVTIFTDYGFAYSFYRTILYSVFNILAINLVAFILALIVVQNLKGKNIYRAAFFMPNLIGGLVLGYIWQFVYNRALPVVADFIINYVVIDGSGFLITWFNSVMLNFSDFLNTILIDGNNALIGIIVVVSWQYAGYIMMIYIAALQNVPQDLVEASKIDGANAIQRLRTIVFPMIAQAFTIAMFLTLTTSFKQFDTVVSLTQGGPSTKLPLWLTNLFNIGYQPVTEALDFLAINIYDEAFVNFEMGIGQAKAITFFAILLLVSLVQVNLNKRREVEL